MKFNKELFNTLPTLLGSNKEHIYDRIGMSKLSYLLSQKTGDIKLGVLVKLCNAYHIHIKLFFQPGIPTILVDNTDTWKPYHWNPSNIRALWASRANPIIRRTDMMAKLGMDKTTCNSTIIRLTSPGSALRASQWCDVCDHFNINIMLPFVPVEEIPNNIRPTHIPYPATQTDNAIYHVAELT